MAIYTGATLYHNHMPFLSQEANHHSVSLNQLILDEHGRLPDRALLATYVCDWEWLFHLLPPSSTQISVALHWHARSGISELPIGSSFKDGIQHVMIDGHMVEIVHPSMPNHYAAVIHAKLFLFEFASFLRVVISSANLTRQDWEGLAQTVWVQDFARVNPPPHQIAEFGADLADFLIHLGMFDTLADALQFLQPFDFSPTVVKLIASVPGVFSGPDAFKYGHARLRNLLKSYDFTPHTTTGVVYQASSVGHTPIPWLQQFLKSVAGEKVDPIIFRPDAYDVTEPKPLTKPNLYIVFPTKKMCEKAMEEDLGAIVLSYFDTSNNVENLKMLYKPVQSRGYAIHSKILMSIQETLGTHYGWLYSGSHNFTVDSWGTLDRDKNGEFTNTIYNYELGVLFPPSTPSGVLANLQLPFKGIEPYKSSDEPWRIAKERKSVMRQQQRLDMAKKFNPSINYHFFRFAEHK